MADKKTVRQDKIKEIIENEVISTQDELVERLISAGFEVTQATVSRDIREMQLTKFQTAAGVLRYKIATDDTQVHESKYMRIFSESFVSMEPAENILVIKTVSGMAMAAAAALDNMKLPKIVGSIAGDDTIICVVKSVNDMENVMDNITSLMG